MNFDFMGKKMTPASAELPVSQMHDKFTQLSFEKHEPFGAFMSLTRANIVLFSPFCAVVYIIEYKWDCHKLNLKMYFSYSYCKYTFQNAKD